MDSKLIMDTYPHDLEYYYEELDRTVERKKMDAQLLEVEVLTVTKFNSEAGQMFFRKWQADKIDARNETLKKKTLFEKEDKEVQKTRTLFD